MSPPNQLTLLRILLTPVFAWLIFSDSPGMKKAALVVYVIAALTDWYDGWVARRWGYITRWGKFFDPLADKILTSTAFVTFVLIGYAAAWMVWIIVVRDIVITLLRSFAEFRHQSIDTSKFAKTKTLIQLFVIYYFLVVYVVRSDPAFVEPLAPYLVRWASRPLMDASMLIVTLLTAVTGVFYIWNNRVIVRGLFSRSVNSSETE